MPKLARLRLVSIGHPRARFDDVALDFRDHDHLAADSMVWLRNGGGKSSLLNLFYSVVRPRQTDFLGGKGGEEHRRLTDYVQPDDHGVIACEWELDSAEGLFDEAPTRYITGVFHEHRSGTESDDPSTVSLQRLFFAAEVDPSEPQLTLDGLPLVVRDSSDRPMRRSMASFRRVWRELRDAHPARDVFLADRQAEWTRQMESRGIDTQLFGYQLDMNAREGGVTELFTFRDQEAFVDFLLKTAFDPQDAERVRQQVQTFRTELTRRHHQLQPDQELCQGLLDRIGPFSELAEERERARQTAGQLFRKHATLQDFLRELAERLSDRIERLRGQASQREAHAVIARHSARLEMSRAIALRRHAINSRLQIAKADQCKKQEEMECASRQLALWKAAVPLAEVLRFEDEARSCRQRLQERKEDNAPLFEQLKEAAGCLAAMVTRDAQALRQRSAAAHENADAHRTKAKDKRQEVVVQGQLAATLETEAKSYATRLGEGKAAREQLIAEDVIKTAEPPETAEQAIARLDERLAQTRAAQHVALRTRQEKQESQSALRDQREQKRLKEVELVNATAALELQIREAADVRDALSGDDTLLILLQAEAAELDRACGPAVGKAKEDVRRASESILELHLASADDQRALAHLREYGRLPPSRDVLMVLERLRDQGLRCWSGWEYLEQNVAVDSRRNVLNARPHLAAGVLLHDADYDAVTPENQDGLALSRPVVIARARTLLQDSGHGDFLVWGPAGDGLFDSSAAGRAEAEIEQRLNAVREQTTQKEDWRQRLQQLIHRLEDYQQRYPAGWFVETQAMREQRESDLRSLRNEIAEETSLITLLSDEIGRLEDKERMLRDQESSLSQQRARAHTFFVQHEQHFDEWRLLLDERLAGAADARCKQQASEKDADQLDAQAKESQRCAGDLGEQARSCEHELEHIRHVQHPLPAPPSIPLETLRETYGLLLDEYEQKVGAESLEHLARQRDRDAANARQRFEKIRDRSISESEIVAAIQTVPVGASPEGAYHQADTALWSAKQAAGNVGAQISRLEDRLQAIDDDERKSDVADLRQAVDPSTSPEAAEEGATEADKASDCASRQAAADETQAHALQQQAHQARIELERVEGQRRGLTSIHQANEMLASQLGGMPTGDMRDECESSEDVEELGRLVDELGRSLNDASRHWGDMDSRAAAHLRQIQAWCRQDRFAALPDGVGQRFEQLDAVTVETRAAYFREHLQTRLQQIRADLAEADKQRDIVIDATMSAVDQAIDLLRRVSRLSKLPDSVRGGGRCFLDITTQAPENPAERRGRIGDLIDEIIASGQLDSGLELVQRAVRRVARPIRVRVLHPDLDAAGHKVDIPQMANFSGGERLTGAILLYCTLARLRSQQLGLTGRRTSVLLLDNPIGTVSRVRFLDLQREVARAMGVQLIYATGVHDLDAIGSLPNVIRLRNSRRDRKTGRLFVEMEPSSEAAHDTEDVIDAVRIHFQPAPNGGAATDEGRDGYG